MNGGMKLWGHYTSKDLVQYKYEGAPFLPDETYDKDGVFSGSAIVWKDKMYLFYTEMWRKREIMIISIPLWSECDPRDI